MDQLLSLDSESSSRTMTIVKDSAAPLVVVVGATGIQGGSVIRELAKSDKPYRLRGLTRDATKPAAQELVKQGVEVYTANIVVGNEEAVKDAFKGGDVIFVSGTYKIVSEDLNLIVHTDRNKLLGASRQEQGILISAISLGWR